MYVYCIIHCPGTCITIIIGIWISIPGPVTFINIHVYILSTLHIYLSVDRLPRVRQYQRNKAPSTDEMDND